MVYEVKRGIGAVMSRVLRTIKSVVFLMLFIRDDYLCVRLKWKVFVRVFRMFGHQTLV